MSVLWECPGCRITYRLRLFRCPRCHGTDVKEKSMPKISRHAGATHAAAGRVQEAAARPPITSEDDPPPMVLPEREHPGTGVPMEGVEWPADGTESPEIEGDGSGEALPLPGDDQNPTIHDFREHLEEEPSPGSSSETSPEKPPTSPETSGSGLQKRARTTGSRSKQGRTGSSTARSTASSTEADAAS